MRKETEVMKRRNKRTEERMARGIFFLCAAFSLLAVFSILLYMIINGTPALIKVGIKEILLKTEWKPTADQPQYGILYVILTSLVGTSMAVLIGTPIGLLTAIFLAEVAPSKAAAVVRPAIELLAGIPSVIYGLLGILLVNPWMYKMERMIFKDSDTHQFTGGSNLLSAVIVLTVMILPTMIRMSETAIRSAPKCLKASSMALGATHIQTICHVILPAAKSGILAAVMLGVGRAIGEAMAITLVSGSSVNAPFPFSAVRFLTTALVSEMAYAGDLHREVLFTIGLVLLALVMIINLVLEKISRNGGGRNA